MSNKVSLNDAGFIEIQVVGDQTAESVAAMGRQIIVLATQLRADGRPVLIYDDLTRLGMTTSEARREVGRLARTLDYDRLVMVGSSGTVMRHGTNLMLRAIGRPDARYFASRDAAYIWLGLDE
jgi:UDP-N-acetylmuramyl pentapeptide synthase